MSLDSPRGPLTGPDITAWPGTTAEARPTKIRQDAHTPKGRSCVCATIPGTDSGTSADITNMRSHPLCPEIKDIDTTSLDLPDSSPFPGRLPGLGVDSNFILELIYHFVNTIFIEKENWEGTRAPSQRRQWTSGDGNSSVSGNPGRESDSQGKTWTGTAGNVIQRGVGGKLVVLSDLRK